MTDSLSDLILQIPPTPDPAWVTYEDQANLRGPQKLYASPLERQPIYAEECRKLHSRLLAPGAQYHDLADDIWTVTSTVPSTLDGGDIPVERYQQDYSENPGLVVVYYHGGGLTVGEADSEQLTCRRIAKRIPGCAVYSIGYRLMPANPATTCLSDAMDGLMAAREECPSSAKLVIVGSSSGGELAALVQQRAPKGLITGVVLRCPVTIDGRTSPERVPERFRGAYTSHSKAFTTSYIPVFMQDAPSHKMQRMPLEAGSDDLRGLGKTWIQLCTNDPLYSDGLCYAMLLKEAGLQVEVDVIMGWPHTFWLTAPHLEKADQAEEAMVRGIEWILE